MSEAVLVMRIMQKQGGINQPSPHIVTCIRSLELLFQQLWNCLVDLDLVEALVGPFSWVWACALEGDCFSYFMIDFW